MPPTCEPQGAEPNWETFLCPGYYLRVWTAKTPETASEWTRGSIAAWSQDTGSDPALEDTLWVGGQDNGSSGTIATYRYTQDGVDVVMSDGVFVHQGTGYDVVVLGPVEDEAIDRALFLQHLATLRFTE